MIEKEKKWWREGRWLGQREQGAREGGKKEVERVKGEEGEMVKGGRD